MTRLKPALLTLMTATVITAVALPAAAHCPDGKAKTHKLVKKTVKKKAVVACNCAKPARKKKVTVQRAPSSPPPPPVDHAPYVEGQGYAAHGVSGGVDLYATSWETATVSHRVVSHTVEYRSGDRLHPVDCREPHHGHVW